MALVGAGSVNAMLVLLSPFTILTILTPFDTVFWAHPKNHSRVCISFPYLMDLSGLTAVLGLIEPIFKYNNRRFLTLISQNP